jgi:predicted metal-dependent phosphoesterase TrpH
MALVDLHLHTTASDGRLTPTQLIELVAGKGLKVVAVTDHDSTEGLAEATTAAARFQQLTLIPGIELSTDVPQSEIHVLGYYIRYQDQEFQATLKRFRDGRELRARRMVDKLATLGMPLDWERVQGFAGDGAIGRPHIALAMVERGYIKEPQEAFVRYISRNGPAYVEREKLTPPEAVRLIVQNGGVAVLAHPAELPDLDQWLTELKAAGLVGMEVFYGTYPPETLKRLKGFAEVYGLLPCGGSDYHGLGSDFEATPGDVGPSLEVVEALQARRTSLRDARG